MFEWMDDITTDEAALYDQSGPYIPEASDCMRCGLCISLCPTYKLVHIEEESPRSRIRTIDKIINDKGNLTADELGHLNNCTQCRACETICPSQMAYGQLFDQARERLLSSQTSKPGTHFLAPLGFKLIEHKKLFSMVTVLLAGYQKSGLATLVRKTRLLRLLKLDKAEALLPQVTIQTLTDHYYPTAQKFRGTVALFTGCIGEHFDQKTLLASIKVLNAIGFTVLIPKTQGCCGALHQHQGQSHVADQLATNNINVFNTLPVDAIIYIASACGLMLKEYELKDSLAIDKFNVPLMDITEFLCMHWPEGLKLNDAALSGKSVAVHEPCSQRNISKVSENKHQYVYSLLEKIQGFKVLPLPDNQTCCGAGGIHCLTHPEIAEPLRTIKLDHFQESRADYLVTTNIGCSLHLSSGLALNKTVSSDKVIHPIVLIAESI
ncbi:MAG: (Fe-S)-binding protein [Methylococcales bacterium]